jgi:hypothetical protein
MAAVGALARILNEGRPQLTLPKVLSDLFVAGFTGLMLYWVSKATDIEGGWVYAAAGIAGWAGHTALDRFANIVIKKTGLVPNLNDKTDEVKP